MIRWTCLVFLLAGIANPVRADDTPPQNRLTFHGYLTQGYGRGWDTPYFGLTDEGTFGYRKAALQVRYDHGQRHTFVIQLAHERFGESPIQDTREDLEVDWAYYQHNFRGGFWARAGKVVVPLGVYNEIRDVGTLLPFYRLSYAVYGEGIFSTETVNGVAAGRRWSAGRWGLDVSGYFGELRQLQADFETETRLRNFAGGQVWVDTPVERLRFGAGYWHADARNSLSGRGPDLRETWDQVVLSAEVEKGPLRLIGEWTRLGYESGPYTGGYVQLSYKATPKLSLHGLYEDAAYEFRDLNDPGAELLTWDHYDREGRLGVTYAFRPDVVLRLEHHLYRGYTVEPEDGTIDTDGPPYRGDHTIAALSVSF